MKLLESIGLVQFFLYEGEDFAIGRNTAFLGPNGTGKTALLDAIQTVMLAADGNRMHFNAAGEGKKRARHLRDYCLGVYGQTPSEHKRTLANTYINLVFRDTETDIPVTAGVSLSASADSTEVSFNSLYILPGVALSTVMHMEKEGGRDVVMPWRSFQHVAKEACRMQGKGSTPLFTTNREEFTRQLLIEHLAAPGDKPNVQALRSAFARSLKLNQDVTDLSEQLRQHLIEPRPTNVRDFRTRLQQFRMFRDMIKRTKERIERAGQVTDKYALVQRERTTEANLECLKAVFDTEQLGETLSEAQVSIENNEAQRVTATLNLTRAKSETARADEAREKAIADLNRDPDFQKQGGQADRLDSQEHELLRKQTALKSELNVVVEAVLAAGRQPELEDHRATFEDALRQVEDLQSQREAGRTPLPVAIQSALKCVADSHERIRRAVGDAEIEQRAARAAQREAELTMERAGRGLVDLRPDTRSLHRILTEAGIAVTPVCDLVTITDARWQPILESYLGPHIDALLVPADKEIEAIEIYRGLKGAQRVYGVKLALPSRTREWRSPGSGTFAAELIDGKNSMAVRYLQGELGRTRLAQSSEELRSGDKSLTMEGMVCSGGGVERRRLPGADELKIGRRDQAGLRTHAEKALKEAKESLAKATSMVERLTAAQRPLMPFANVDAGVAALDRQFTDLGRLTEEVTELRTRLASTLTVALETLQETKAAADQRVIQARQAESDFSTEATRLEERIRKEREQLEGLLQQLALASRREQQAREHAFYDANEVERHRARLDERHGEQWEPKLAACNAAIHRSRTTAENADREGWKLFCEYVAAYDQKEHGIASQEWERAFAFTLAQQKYLQELELVEQEAKSEEAYEAAVKVFRTDVAQALLAGFDRIDEQMDSLNRVLKSAPPFSNNERYQFRKHPVDQHRALYEFLKRVREQGGEEDEDLFGGAGTTPEEFRLLIEGNDESELLLESSPLNDHRRFFSYDVELFHDDKSMGWLSKRLGPGSGGEHRTPLYIIFGAALAAAYGKVSGNQGGGSIMILDEAFEKMDPQNVRATADYLNALGLQLIMAGPETDQPKLSSFLDVYYDLARYGSDAITVSMNVVSEQARELLESDNFHAHPELFEQEVARLRNQGFTGRAS